MRHPDPIPSELKTYVNDVVTRSNSSFTLGMRLLPGLRRYAMFAIYTFAREIDDIADSNDSQQSKLKQLDSWRTELDHLYSGTPHTSTSCALLDPISRFCLPKEEFLALIHGMEMDIRAEMVAPSWDDLRLYCRRVAGSVGMLSLCVLGLSSVDAEALALSLGEGFQLTNILRDLDEDAALGRLYIPRELLEEHEIDLRLSPCHIVDSPAIHASCCALATQAYQCYHTADMILARLDRRYIYPILLMFGIYERMLIHLEKQGWHPPRTPLHLSKIEKLWAAIQKGLLRNLFHKPWPKSI